jgi:hypothetical protein
MGTESIQEIYMGGCVDPIVSACSINTDHHIVAADFDFSFKSRIPSTSIKEEKYHWNRISKILVDMERPISSDQQEAPEITFRESTARTSQYLQNQDLFEDLRAITREDSELESLIAVPFLEEMILIRGMLVAESKKLTREEQEKGNLIARRKEVKTRCNNEMIKYWDGLKTAMCQIKLRKMVDPVGQIQKNIENILNRKDEIEKDASVKSITHLIERINRAMANSKKLRRTTKKIKQHDPTSKEYKALIKSARGHAACITKMEKNYDIAGNLKRITHAASAQQEDRECIQETLGKHRSLNPYGGSI